MHLSSQCYKNLGVFWMPLAIFERISTLKFSLYRRMRPLILEQLVVVVESLVLYPRYIDVETFLQRISDTLIHKESCHVL